MVLFDSITYLLIVIRNEVNGGAILRAPSPVPRLIRDDYSRCETLAFPNCWSRSGGARPQLEA